MGKAILIISLLLLAVVVAIVVSSSKGSDKVPVIVTDDVANSQARSLSNYALQYGMSELLKGNVTFADSTHGSIDSFVPMNVFDGSIDSITYSRMSEGTVRLDSYVSYQELESHATHHAFARFGFYTGEGTVSNITAAIVTGGSITIKAHAVVNGTIIEDSTFNFEEVFGFTEQEVKDECVSLGSYIETPANNEPMPDSLTWMDNNLRVQSFWSGAGILIINGDLNATAQIEFSGILVVFGNVNFGAHSDITGAVYVIGDSSLGAHAEISFDADVVRDAFDAFPIEITIEIIEWNEG